MSGEPALPVRRFGGKRVLVTGASRGIGAATAHRLAAEGATVAIAARTRSSHPTLPGSLDRTLAGLAGDGHRVFEADLSFAEDRARLADEVQEAFGGVDVLVNNAAAAMYQPMVELPLKRRRLMTEVNLMAPIDLCQAFAPGMAERGEGWIVNVSSGSATHRSGPPFDQRTQGATIGFYGATKAALNRYTNALAMELHPAGVRVNTVEPRAAVLSEGADALVGTQLSEDRIESMEAMVEAIAAVASCGPDRTGRVEVSLDLLTELDLTVMELDASGPYPGGYRRIHP